MWTRRWNGSCVCVGKPLANQSTISTKEPLQEEDWLYFCRLAEWEIICFQNQPNSRKVNMRDVEGLKANYRGRRLRTFEAAIEHGSALLTELQCRYELHGMDN